MYEDGIHDINGTISYYKNGQLHRIDGPAVCRKGDWSYQCWYWRGRLLYSTAWPRIPKDKHPENEEIVKKCMTILAGSDVDAKVKATEVLSKFSPWSGKICGPEKVKVDIIEITNGRL